MKTYPPKGNLQQFRLEQPHEFQCARCGGTKKSRLVTVKDGDWGKLLCNGCYGYVLSRDGSAANDEDGA